MKRTPRAAGAQTPLAGGNVNPMHRLFLRIFLSVLLTVLFTLAVSLLIAIWLMPHMPVFPPPLEATGGERTTADADQVWCERVGALLAMRMPAVAGALENGDHTAIEHERQQLAAEWGVRLYIVGAQGEEFDGQVLTPTARGLAASARAHADVQLAHEERVIAAGLAVPAEAGGQYVLVGEVPRRPRPPASEFAWMALLRNAPVAIGLGVVCYFLAGYITGPLLKLRAALRRFAEGDLTQRVGPAVGKRRDEIGELARDFDHMAERIATLVSAQQRLLQDISHELRSPLARQRVALELVRQQDCGPAATRLLGRVELEAERLEALVDELLRLTRDENDSHVTPRSAVELASCVHEVLENAEFEACNGTRSIRLGNCISCETAGNGELLRRALENVVRNALRYTAEGTAVEVSLDRDGAEAVIRVRDHGPGVPEGELTEIFRPFYRVSRARERESGGTGLGLAIAARAVQLHGGTIRAQNAAGGGLLVELRLPVQAAGRGTPASA